MSGSGTESDTKQKQVEALPIGKSTKPEAHFSFSKWVVHSMLEYKCNWNDKQFVKIDRFFPSSKTCSKCGWIKQDLTLNIREWSCISCGENHDRDFNASQNILKQGLNILSGSGTESDTKQKQMEALPIGKSLKSEAHFSFSKWVVHPSGLQDQ